MCGVFLVTAIYEKGGEMNEEEARKILNYMMAPNGCLVLAGHTLWSGGSVFITDLKGGCFAAETLRAIVWWMEHKTIRAVDRVIP